jgi:hypothetical protein
MIESRSIKKSTPESYMPNGQDRGHRVMSDMIDASNGNELVDDLI